MKPEYEVIYDREVKEFCLHTSYVTVYGRPISTYIRGLISECEQLADQRIAEIENRPQVRLSGAEINRFWDVLCKEISWTDGLIKFQDAILAAQKPKPEPVDVPFDFERWSRGGWQAYRRVGIEGSEYWPVDELEPESVYIMRRK